MMTGQDNIHDKSPENLAMIAVAAFSASYNLPVYLRYNATFRRAYIRMMRCDDRRLETQVNIGQSISTS